MECGMEAKLRATLWDYRLNVERQGSNQDKIQGLTSGADDYVTKPIQPIRNYCAGQIILRRQSTYQKKWQSRM